MIKIADFIFRNWRIFALVYAIGGTVVFILSLVFMRLLAKWADYDVTPRAGVWIEMDSPVEAIESLSSLPVRECGLKYLNELASPWKHCHSPCGSVD